MADIITTIAARLGGEGPPRIDSILVDGRWHPASDGASFESIDPSYETKVGEISAGTAHDIDAAVESATEAMRGPWRDVSAAARGRVLLRLADLIEEHRELLALAESREVGKPISSARGDIDGAVDTLRYNAGAADKLEGATIPVAPNILDFTLLEPLGATAHIVPWNFPIGMALRSIAPALAAGCTAVLKPAEEASLSSAVLGELALRAGLPAGVLNVVTGLGEAAGAALTRHPGIKGITFTGSVETGRKVYASAAAGIKPVVLELGGKNPLIVCEDADLDRAIASAMAGAFENCGQICAASSRLLVHDAVADRFVAGLMDAMKRLRVGPADADLELGPLVSAQQHRKVLGIVEQTGGRVRAGGSRPANLERGYFVAPTLVDELAVDDLLCRTEVFGPVVGVQRFGSDAEAIALANGTGFGLAAGVHTRDIGRAMAFVKALESGSVWINGWFLGGVQAPNGGVKASGIGRERGLPGLRNYLSIKNVAIQL